MSDEFVLSRGQARALMLGMKCPAWFNVEKYLTAEDVALFKEACVLLSPAAVGDGSTARSRPVSTSLRIVDSNPAHVTASLFVGRTPGARGNSGQIVLRRDEFDELVASGWVDEVNHG